MPPDWSRLFGSGDFRWHLGLAPGDVQAFFAPTEDHTNLLAERRHWLDEEPEEYARLTAEGAPLFAETLARARHWGFAVNAESSLEDLGRIWEPDFVLLSCSDRGLVVEGGVVCFPTAWSLPEKIGRSLLETHGPVPRLNSELSPRIETALRKLAPGAAWSRENWGLARTDELNLHVKRPRPRLDETITPDEVWLRVERQVLFKLPTTGGLLFGIRLERIPLPHLLKDATARPLLHRALSTMPDDAADYKGLSTARPALLRWLG